MSFRPFRAGPTLIIAAGLALAGCGDNQDPEEADALWQRIQDSGYRTAWARAPGYGSRRASDAPHGGEVDIYVNDVVATPLAGAPLSSGPEGSGIVKDGWDGAPLELVATMEKRQDGWFWAEYDAEGSASYSGHPDTCTSCHASGSDFVRAFALPSP